MASWWWIALVVVVVLGVFASVADGWGRSGRGPGRRGPGRPGGRGRPPRGPGGARVPGPRPGEIWWALVPFEDGPGGKDRPCLVLSVTRRSARVVKITSRFHEERPGVLALPEGAVDDSRGRRSFLETDELRTVALREFRRRAGAVDPALWDRVRHLG
ncbi:type II toxin-antitoxin system PemK/MazF family toxin [Streptomyces sp. NPDC007088]|uniref:type II toxin-antitoxin system PemK/MazF family toxin n=1 Tax=Streptomyces sp. NPDC007088 TaxID=3364773 RepID=UPI003684C300